MSPRHASIDQHSQGPGQTPAAPQLAACPRSRTDTAFLCALTSHVAAVPGGPLLKYQRVGGPRCGVGTQELCGSPLLLTRLFLCAASALAGWAPGIQAHPSFSGHVSPRPLPHSSQQPEGLAQSCPDPELTVIAMAFFYPRGVKATGPGVTWPGCKSQCPHSLGPLEPPFPPL